MRRCFIPKEKSTKITVFSILKTYQLKFFLNFTIADIFILHTNFRFCAAVMWDKSWVFDNGSHFCKAS
jgi:hypothetical protein